jgi:uncharacterized membrane protein YkvA (DUF1232 family)
VLLRRLLGDGRVPRTPKLLVPAAIAYVALPFDLVSDMIPVAGALDDALVVTLVLRLLLRGSGRGLVREHWPGPDRSRALVERLAG